MIDYAKKALVLTDNADLLDLAFEWSRLQFFSAYCPDKCDFDRMETVKETVFYILQDEILGSVFRECEKIVRAYYARVSRLRYRISDLLEMGDCIFVTLTFTDDVLSNTSESTRRKYVTRFLASISCHYVANIDFGVENGREHYHAVVVRSADIDCSLWKYGAINFRRIHNKNKTALAKYIAKLTNHAIKETTRRNHVIYSRSRWSDDNGEVWDTLTLDDAIALFSV